MSGSRASQTRFNLIRFVLDNSLLLVIGTIAAVVWANVDVASYDRVAHWLHVVALEDVVATCA